MSASSLHDIEAQSIHSSTTDSETSTVLQPVRSNQGGVHSDKEHDGYRPCQCEDGLRRLRSRPNGSLNRSESIVSRVRSRPTVPRFTHPLAREKTSQDQLVDFDGPDDPYRPINWPMHKKGQHDAAVRPRHDERHLGLVGLLGRHAAGRRRVSRRHAGGRPGHDAVPGGLWRRPAPLGAALRGVRTQSRGAGSHTIMITRFFGAFFASAPVTNTGGVLGDLFSPAHRGIAMAGYAMAVVGGPTLGPIVSAAVVAQPWLGWRWTEYLTGILQSFILLMAIIFTDESYPPKLLVAKASKLRHETGNWALHAKFEEWDVSISELSRKFLVRPIQLLCTPICFLVALYASFCYGILYMQLGAVPIIFEEIRGWNSFTAELPFIAILLGSITGAGINIANQFWYNKAYHAAGDRAVPEKRLPPMMFGSILFGGSLFMTGWTAQPDVHWIVPVIGLYLTGTGFNTIFQAALNYLVDTFQMYAASAVAANTFLRSCFAAAFPLVVSPLYHNIGVGPGSSIFGGFACLMIPVPFIFYVFGKRIRAASKWSKASVF
ncbi:hypothetical protein G7054_g9500 [Neopestalotiopsis clavispora]|nr:hypothetical protein G7054_g9500 [Neopestalotiopsis clavispora]